MTSQVQVSQINKASPKCHAPCHAPMHHTRHPCTGPMHGPTCPSSQTHFWPALNLGYPDYTILLLCNKKNLISPYRRIHSVLFWDPYFAPPDWFRMLKVVYFKPKLSNLHNQLGDITAAIQLDEVTYYTTDTHSHLQEKRALPRSYLKSNNIKAIMITIEAHFGWNHRYLIE